MIRTKFTLWLLRQLAPKGLGHTLPYLSVDFSHGASTPGAPALVVTVVDPPTRTMIVAMAFHPPEAVEQFADQLRDAGRSVREWADGQPS